MNLTKQDIENQLLSLTEQFIQESNEEHIQRKIALDASLQQHLGIDSLGRSELFHRIEKRFDVRLSDQLLAEAETLNDIVKVICDLSPSAKFVLQEQEVSRSLLEETHVDPTKAKTLIELLQLYVEHYPNRPHVYLQNESNKEEIITYDTLFKSAQRIAQALINQGLKPGETVAIMLPTSVGFFYTFFGILLAGCIPVPIYPPFRLAHIEAYAKQEAKILQNAEVRILVTFQQAERLSRLLRTFVPSLKAVTTVDTLLQTTEKAPIRAAKSTDFALIQYTSGSTSTPKGVLLTHQNLLANIRAWGKAIQFSSRDRVVSWLPLYHDLGLIGAWLGSLYHGAPLTLLSPLSFLNRPERWLWAIHYHRGTISAAPNFAYELCVHKIEPAVIEGLDLRSWRVAANGAEVIQPKTLEHFAKRFASYGFKREALLTVYGLAESCVGLTSPPLNRGPRIDFIDRNLFELERRAVSVDQTNTKNTLQFISCGFPLVEHEVRIVNEKNHVLPEREVGFLQFRGPSNMQGYYRNPEATQAVYHDGWLDSGDLAYQAEGEVYITGRQKDLIIKAGRNVYPAELEELTGQVSGIRTGCVIAFGVVDPEQGTEKLIVVAETRDKKIPQRDIIIQQINEKLGNALDVVPDHIVLVPPHTIPKTSSGKLQRSACKQAYLDRKLTKRKLPVWLQISKLTFNKVAIKIKQGIHFLIKLFFTFYIATVFLGTFPAGYLSLFLFSRKHAAIVYKYWARLLMFLAFCPVKIKGKEYIDKTKPFIYVANHASYIDVVLLIGILPPGVRFIGKKELFNVPIVGTFMKRLGHVFVDRSDFSKSIENTRQIEKVLQEGASVIIFPEGTFTYAEGLRPFKPGAFKVAADTGIGICPIAIQGTRKILRDEEYLFNPGRVKMILSAPMYAEGKDWSAISRLRMQAHKKIAQDCGESSLDLITVVTGSAVVKPKTN